jgi:hypothetical protein
MESNGSSDTSVPRLEAGCRCGTSVVGGWRGGAGAGAVGCTMGGAGPTPPVLLDDVHNSVFCATVFDGESMEVTLFTQPRQPKVFASMGLLQNDLLE